MKKLEKVTKYKIFKTKWGYFGLAYSEKGIIRTILPCSTGGKLSWAEMYKCKLLLLDNLKNPKHDCGLSKNLQNQIVRYFKGTPTTISRNISVSLEGFTKFQVSVLNACRKIPLGQTISYAQLARNAGYPGAARAVGRTLALNPLPLLIPCHRVVRSDGGLGGFSAPGGINLKKRLILHEKASLLKQP